MESQEKNICPDEDSREQNNPAYVPVFPPANF